MSESADFSDLGTRIISAAVLGIVGFGPIWVGGVAFDALLVIAAGVMGWETSRMHTSRTQVQYVFGLILAALVTGLIFLPTLWSAPLLLVLAGTAVFAHRTGWIVVLGAAAIILACVTLHNIRTEFGFGWTVWVLLLVIAGDAGGYFVGKLVGGPKILPAISPKKTCSGTLGGWALAAIVGFGAVEAGLADTGIILLSVLVVIAAQIGDLLESAMKRKAKIKDSSNLIPGHGGLLDRFDGTVGASCAVGIFLFLDGFYTSGLA